MSEAASRPLYAGISLVSQDAAQLTGTATYVDQVLRYLADEPDLTVEVLCNANAHAALAHRARGAVRLKQANLPVGRSRPARAAAIAGASLFPAPLARQFSPQVQVVHYPLNFMIPAVKLPTVVTLHDVQHRDLPQYFSRAQRAWRDHFYRLAASRATIMVTDSEHARQRIAAEYGVPLERIVAVHLAVDHDRFQPQPGADEEAARARLDLPERYLYYPASFWPHKHHAQLFDAVARLPDPEIQLVLTGAPFGRLDETLHIAARAGLEGRVRYLGLVAGDDVPVIYRGAVATVFPSTYEGFGMPPLEAMACGCPVASSLATSLSEVCGDVAVELDPWDPAQMATAIGSILGDDGRRARLRTDGIARAAAFTWARAANSHLDLYRLAAFADTVSALPRARRSRL